MSVGADQGVLDRHNVLRLRSPATYVSSAKHRCDALESRTN
jgi:hypothetical protein